MIASTCLALAIFFEAGLEPIEGQIAVGNVVMNRVETKNICHEVLHTAHFIGVMSYFETHTKPPTTKNFHKVVKLAKKLINGKIPDITGGATHFECTQWKSCAKPPKWSIGMEYRGMFGTQNFWREK